MLDSINFNQGSTGHKTHRLHIACDDKARSESDLLHRFVAQLKLQNYRIEKMDITESPITAKVTFARMTTDLIESHSIISLFKRKRLKAETQFKINFFIYKLDRLGLNFFIDYKLENRPRQADGFNEYAMDDDIHAMMKTAFDGASSFLISRMPDLET